MGIHGVLYTETARPDTRAYATIDTLGYNSSAFQRDLAISSLASMTAHPGSMFISEAVEAARHYSGAFISRAAEAVRDYIR